MPNRKWGGWNFKKKDRQAIVVYTQYPTEIAEGAIMDKMERLGNKGKESKGGLFSKGGFLEFKGVSIPDLKISGVDFYFKADRKSRQEKDESIIYLVIGRGSDEFVTTETDPQIIDNAKIFMNNLLPHVEAYNLEVQIKQQEDMIKKLDNRMTDLLKDSTDLDKKLKSLQEKLQQNSLDRQKQMAELDKQRLTLDAMKGKRKT